ncbi:MAG: hypothetical protein BSOLF_1347 [Candidatus Carbobacillus altaicus]|uniref:Uncharacterized protein n=1 Tax=Candidatus Carbonibacillus altaicus TaxID=2163959 RepID=A0A2R6Y457_9BACL|nr:MAG: hypothetical protein BSOLF_1347 [Candidatus Carbobacillus altaicus]
MNTLNEHVKQTVEETIEEIVIETIPLLMRMAKRCGTG